jgi:hypothetical protein
LAVVLLGDRWSRLYHRNIVDDALISLRYAQQWVAGNGLVFNTGERVEGYTNFLWTILLGAGVVGSDLLGVDPIRMASVSGLFFAALDVVLVYLVGRRLWGSRVLPTIVALGLVVLDNAYVVWSFLGLEAHFVSFWMLLALLVWQGRGRLWGVRLGLVLAALWMTRPDAGLFVVSLLGSEAFEVLLRWRRERGRRRGVRPGTAAEGRRPAGFAPLIQASSLCLFVFGGYFTWRAGYYGDLLPNTFYAKVGGEGFDAWVRGGRYLAGFLAERAWVPCIAVLAAIGLRDPVIRALFGWASLYVLYIVAIGGDFYPGHRFFVILIPVLGLLVGYAFHRIERAIAGADSGGGDRAVRVVLWGGAVSMLLSVGAFGLLYGPIETEVRRYGDTLQRSRELMTWVGAHSDPDDRVLADTIGVVGVFADRRVLDFHGIVDAEIAHQQVDTLGQGKAGHEKTASLESILARRPEIMKFGLLFVNHYEHGYYLDVSMPIALRVPGIWRHDTLPETHRRVGTSLLTGEPIEGAGWSRTGDAFAVFPATRGVHQLPGGAAHFPLGQSGAYASSWSEARGAAATGRLVSAAFPLVGDRLSLRVAGGFDPERLRVCLEIEGRKLDCATGFESLAFGRWLFDIAPYQGELARLTIVDASSARNGVILVDEVQQWASRAGSDTAGGPQRDDAPR